jgi:hypothetical protein
MIRSEIDLWIEELLDERPESIGLREAGNLVAEFEVFQDLLDIWREAIEVCFEVSL